MDYTGLLIFGGFFAFMYAFIIRPQQKRQKEARALMDSLAVGDEVISIGGLHGRVSGLEDKTATLRLADGVEVVFERAAIASKVTADDDE